MIRGRTHGYRHHPQLERFRDHPAPVSAINNYLHGIALKADTQGYRFDRSRIGPVRHYGLIEVGKGQLAFELAYLRAKVRIRAPRELERLQGIVNECWFDERHHKMLALR